MTKYSYVGLEFSQRENESLVTFVAPVGEIKAWAGVPRKHFNYQHGFQRSLADKRVNELKTFYALDSQNVTPTSVVVAIRKGACKVTPIQVNGLQEENGRLCSIEFNVEEISGKSTHELIVDAIEVVKIRLKQLETKQVDDDINSAVEVAIEAETEESANLQDETAGSHDLSDPPTSHLLHFYSELIGMREGKLQIQDDDKLREVLYSLLKPAIIVDGQHRVYGAASFTEKMKFSVNAIPDADWLEQVFQFVVINQKAKPIEPAFLHSIIATSLTDDEIGTLYDRLRKSGVDVDKAQFMNRINTDGDSPFKGMIDFEVEGSPGFLKFPGMSTLAKAFRNLKKDYPGLVPDGIDWSSEAHWIPHFYAFWKGVKEYFVEKDERLWLEPTENNPNNLLKIVTLQEIQRIVIESWADARLFKLVDPQGTYVASKNFWEGFPSQFFSDEWKKKGLQTAVGRKYLSDAIQQTRRNIDRKSWGHRRLGLFQDA